MDQKVKTASADTFIKIGVIVAFRHFFRWSNCLNAMVATNVNDERLFMPYKLIRFYLKFCSLHSHYFLVPEIVIHRIAAVHQTATVSLAL